MLENPSFLEQHTQELVRESNKFVLLDGRCLIYNWDSYIKK